MMEKLYGNIGRKIKYLVFIVFILGSIGGIILGLSIFANGMDRTDVSTALLGFFIMVLSPIPVFIATWLLYAFAELVEKTSSIEKILQDKE